MKNTLMDPRVTKWLYSYEAIETPSELIISQDSVRLGWVEDVEEWLELDTRRKPNANK